MLGGNQDTNSPFETEVVLLGGFTRGANYYVDNHQQYLAKNPNGYRCHANTGVKSPATA